MIDRETELRHHAMGERHIADAERLIERLGQLVITHRMRGEDADHALRYIARMKRALAAFRIHQQQLAETIEASDSNPSPGGPPSPS